MVLTAEEDTQHADLTRCLIRNEVEHSIVLGHMSKPCHDLWLERPLERHVPKPFQRILDVTKSLCSARQRLFDRITKVAICPEQVIKDDLEICIT
ncbi:hypothetical protein ACEWPL_017420 [Roseovarius sp. S1116L3]|uniref:hypothetical protein n=1 Tax=Roseovarius roseus TaxID=3342636 RepID=UPI0037294AC9